MAIRFLLDEHLRGRLWRAIDRHNRAGGHLVDAVCIGDPPDLPLGTPDPDILVWGELNGRVVLTQDVQTMPGYFAAHLAAGRHSPGLGIVRKGPTLGHLVAFLELVAHAGDPADYADQITYLP